LQKGIKAGKIKNTTMFVLALSKTLMTDPLTKVLYTTKQSRDLDGNITDFHEIEQIKTYTPTAHAKLLEKATKEGWDILVPNAG